MKIITSGKIITDILLDKPFDYWHENPNYELDKPHDALAKSIKDFELYSFIGGMVPLRNEFFEYKNKNVAVQENILVSGIRREARKRVKYTDMDVIRKHFDALEIPKFVKARTGFFTKFADEWFSSDEEKLFPEIVAEALKAARFDYDGDHEVELKGKALEKAEQEALKQLYTPEAVANFSRRTDRLPKLLRSWIGVWNQWYVAVTPEKTLVAQGSYRGSGTRETHGYYGHAFAKLAKAGKTIPTFYVGLDKNNVMHLQKKVETFKVVGHDLDGNYRSGTSHTARDKFFGDMLVYVRDGKVYEKEGYKS